MIYQIFSVYDSKVGAYLPPVFQRSKGEAIRAMEAALNEPSHAFAKTPDDFTLFHLGDYDDENGMIDAFATPAPIGKAIEFIRDK